MIRFTALVLAGLAFAAQAQAMSATQSVLKEVRTLDPTGDVSISYIAADLVTPGETVVYRVDYLNDGNEPVTDFELTMPVPSEILFSEVIETDTSQTVVYSADGGQSFYDLSELVMMTDFGEPRLAGPEDITHVRWTIHGNMVPETKGYVAFKGVLE